MREIKFRAWNHKISKMLHNVQLCGHTGKVASAHSSYDYPVMQYTGLKDKNGKEIYEGDIVRTRDDWDEFGLQAGEINEVYFSNGGFRLKPKFSNANGFWVEDGECFQIIGNLHENPELIK